MENSRCNGCGARINESKCAYCGSRHNIPKPRSSIEDSMLLLIKSGLATRRDVLLESGMPEPSDCIDFMIDNPAAVSRAKHLNKKSLLRNQIKEKLNYNAPKILTIKELSAILDD